MALCPSVSAQTKSTRSDLAIKIAGYDPFQASERDGGWIEISPPEKLVNWQPPPDTVPLTRLRIRPVIEGDGVRIKIGGVFDDSQPVDAPGPKYGEKETIIASYFGRLNETVTVSELEQYGFKALSLMIVAFQPRGEKSSTPLTSLPPVKNDLKTVAVVDWKPEGARDPYSARLTLKNFSALNIVCYTVALTGGFSQTSEGTHANPIAKAGGTFDDIIGLRDERTDPETALVIIAVLFEDGSFEGDSDAAAQLASRLRGREIQLTRFLELLRSTKTDSSAPELLQHLKANVERFRVDVAPEDVEQLRAQFGYSPEKSRTAITGNIMEGLKAERSRALFMINEVERRLSEKPSAPMNAAQSLSSLQARVEKLIGKP